MAENRCNPQIRKFVATNTAVSDACRFIHLSLLHCLLPCFLCSENIAEGGKLYYSGTYVNVTSSEKLLNYLITV